MKTKNRFHRIVFLSLLVVCAVFILLLSFPPQQEGLRIRWTGKMSLNTQEQRYFVHRDAEPFEVFTRYNIGPIQITQKRKRD